MYIKNELSRSRLSKVRALQTDIHTDRCNWRHHCTAFADGKKSAHKTLAVTVWWTSKFHTRHTYHHLLTKNARCDITCKKVNGIIFLQAHLPLIGLEPAGTKSVTRGQFSARPTVSFPASQHHCPLTDTKLYCLVTEAHRCK